MAQLKPVIEESFTQYSGAVLQSRALVDVRDCVKPSARQIFYCMQTDKFTADKPFRKTLKAVGSAMRMYIHGDSSCEGVIMRAGQPFAMRYPLIEVEGSHGNLMESGNWAAPRYTSARLSPLASFLFKDMDKNTIDDWRDNYDDTEKYPAVLPSKGYYNICNGSFGIGIGMGSSIPQFNLNEVNNALIRLLLNPDVDGRNLVCLPDFATGAILMNGSEVRNSLASGSGKACQLRSVVDFDSKDNCLVVTQIPYGVYTNTICGELEAILESEENPGIDRFNDLTGETPLIKIYLTKAANAQTVLRYLFKNTSLQHWYAINFTMLDNGRFPRIFTWKEALQAHIDHEKIVYRKGFEFDRQKAQDRLHIVEGILIAIANIDEVVAVIKASTSTATAANELKKRFILDDAQVKAILDMKLSRLAHLEVEKFERERDSLKAEIERITRILNDERLFNDQLIAGWREVATKFGDARRTQVMDCDTTADEEGTPTEVERKEEPTLNLFTSANGLLCLPIAAKYALNDKSSPYKNITVRGGYISTSTATDYVYNDAGQVFIINNNELDLGMMNPIAADGTLIGAIHDIDKKYLISVTNCGTVKKSLMSEYTFKRSFAACKVRTGESVIFIGGADDTDFVYLLNVNHKVTKLAVTDITTTGRATIGAKGNDGQGVLCATVASDTDILFTAAGNKGKFSKGDAFVANAKGSSGQVVTEDISYLGRIGEHGLYIIEKGVKLTQAKPAGTKGKTAVGAKISAVQDPQFAM